MSAGHGGGGYSGGHGGGGYSGGHGGELSVQLDLRMTDSDFRSVESILYCFRTGLN